MSIIKELVVTKHLTLPEPISMWLHASSLLREYYTIIYVSGVVKTYDSYIDLPKRAKKMIKGVGLTNERRLNNIIIRDTVYKVR